MAKRYGERDPMLAYSAFFRDAAYAYPALQSCLVSDQARLERWIMLEGKNVYYTFLPDAAKHLDRCLAAGAYCPSGLPLTKGSQRLKQLPIFLRELYLRVFDPSGSLKQDPDAQAIFFLRQALCMMKKDKVMCSEEKVRQEVESFCLVDATLPEPGWFWDDPQPSVRQVMEMEPAHRRPYYLNKLRDVEGGGSIQIDPRLHALLIRVDMVFNLISTYLGPFRPEDWRFRHGPGVTSDRGRYEDKYRWTNWSDRLENVFPIADYGYHNYNGWANCVNLFGVQGMEPSARLVAVPKTFNRPRLIAAEPSEHQWCQQNVWHYFSTRTRGTWISNFVRFRDQTLNQELCVRSSRDTRCATVDLKAASDHVSCPMVEVAFRRNPGLLLALQATRTRFLEQHLSRDWGDVIELNKFSTMGNACTFPVESLVFLGLTLASVLTARELPVTLESILGLVGEVAVFGDDIVVPVDSREIFEVCFKVFDFEINHAKTFWTGKFRESCGVDAFDGQIVTPVFWQSPTEDRAESFASAVAVSNNLYNRFLIETACAAASTTVNDVNRTLVPMDSGFCALKSFVKPRRESVHSRWNKHLMELEYKVPYVTSKRQVTPRTDDSALLQFFTEAPEPSHPWEGGVRQRPDLELVRGWVPARYLD